MKCKSKRSRARRTARVMACTLLVSSFPAAGAQAGTLDQQQADVEGGGFAAVWGPSLGDGFSLAQTFTARASGALDQVDLYLVRDQGEQPGEAPLTVELRDVDSAGFPGSSVLASASVPSASIPAFAPAWITIPIPSPALVEAGTPYAIVAYAGGASVYSWVFVPEDRYPDGRQSSSETSPPSSWNSLHPANDQAFKTYVEPQADLSLTMTGPSEASTRSQVTYLLTVRNKGPRTANNVKLTDRLPYGTQLTTAVASQGSCTPPGRKVATVTCNLGDLASGGDSTSAVTVKVTAKPAQGSVNSVASVTSDTVDPDPSNNSASFATTVTK